MFEFIAVFVNELHNQIHNLLPLYKLKFVWRK